MYEKLTDPATPVHQMLTEYLAFKKNRALAMITPGSDLSMQDRIRADLGTGVLLGSVGTRLINSLPRTGFETDRATYERESEHRTGEVQYPYSALSALPSFTDMLGGSGDAHVLDRLAGEMVKSEALRLENIRTTQGKPAGPGFKYDDRDAPSSLVSEDYANKFNRVESIQQLKHQEQLRRRQYAQNHEA